MTIDIVGAGIGGLTTAIALQQKGIKTRVFEQAEQIKPVGAGIILANNAMQVYNKIGIKNIIEDQGNHISSMNITKSSLKPLSKIDLAHFEQKYQTRNIAIHRGKLQQILIDCLKPGTLQLNHQLSSIDQLETGSNLRFENGIQIQSSIILGADGLNSVVRQHMFPDTMVRHPNQICWRGVSDFELPSEFKHELNEAWGKAERFGFVQISQNKVYWYALKSYQKSTEEVSADDLEQYFSRYHPVVKDIIKSTKKLQINTAKISDLKPTKVWFKNNICLIGDAAHATTPNMGQGACQAIEDAYVLSECLKKYEIQRAFKTFQDLRLPKAHQVVKTSWMIGKMAHLTNPILIGLRNKALQLTPSSFSRKQNEQIFQLATI